MKRYLSNIVIILLAVSIFFPSLIATQSRLGVKERRGLFISRKGRAEIGNGVNGRVFFDNELGSREVIETNSAMMVKKDSRGEFLIREGETTLFENTTLFIEKFNEEELVAVLMHGVIESNFSKVENSFPIIIETDSVVIKTRKNTTFRLRNDEETMSGGVLVKSGYVWAFDKLNPEVCAIIKEGESIIIPPNGTIFDAKKSPSVSIIGDCTDEFENDLYSGSTSFSGSSDDTTNVDSSSDSDFCSGDASDFEVDLETYED